MAARDEQQAASPSVPPHLSDSTWFQRLVESLPQLVWTSAPDGACDYVSPRWTDYSGLPADDLLGFRWMALLHPDDRHGLQEVWTAAQVAGTMFNVELRLRGRDGVHRWFDVRAEPQRGPSGEIERWFGSNTDIEDRHAAQAALQSSEHRVQTVLDNMSEGLVIADLLGDVLYWNGAGLAMHDFATLEEGIQGLAAFAEVFEVRTLQGVVVPVDDWPLSRILRGEEVRDAELRVRRVDRSWDRVLRYDGHQLRELGGQPLAFLTIADLTERYRAVEGRLESEERLRLANEAAGIGTYDIDFSLGNIRYSPEMCALLGVDGVAEHPLDESLGFVHPDDAADFDRLFAAARDPEGSGTARGEHRFVHSSGEVRWAAWSARTSFRATPEGRRPVRTVGAYVDITEPRRAERRLATQNAVSRTLVDLALTGEAVPEIIRSLCESEGWDLGAYWEVDPAAGALRCVDLWCRDDAVFAPFIAATRMHTFGLGEGLPGRVWVSAAPIMIDDVGHDGGYERAAAALAVGLRSAVAFPIVVRGEVAGVLDLVGRAAMGHGGEPLEMLAAIGRQLGLYLERKQADDERQQLGAQLREARQMEAIGALSGGIAHDFNNILSAIVGNVGLALEDVGTGHPAVESLTAIDEASQHARALVQQILTFAQQRPVERRIVDLGLLVAESARLLRATVPAGVEIVVQVDPGVPAVSADVTQVHQVITNLGTNAWHALQGRAGHIEISLTAVSVDEARVRRLPGLRPGSFALIAVRDTGAGIEPAVLDRIFDPFFTTKAHGSGTGLGLSVVHGIVQHHEGVILVTSEPGHGTTFEVYLPAADGHASQLVPSGAGVSVRGYGEHVLFVDDQAALVALAERMLPRLGYRVTACSDPVRALEVFARDPDDFAVVVTDMNMPRRSGMEVAEEVHRLRPELPVVLLSGYVAPQLLDEARRRGLREVVHKPVDMRTLGDMLDRVLHPPAG